MVHAGLHQRMPRHVFILINVLFICANHQQISCSNTGAALQNTGESIKQSPAEQTEQPSKDAERLIDPLEKSPNVKGELTKTIAGVESGQRHQHTESLNGAHRKPSSAANPEPTVRFRRADVSPVNDYSDECSESVHEQRNVKRKRETGENVKQSPSCQPSLPEPTEPFQVVWNHPDPCERQWPMNFSHYGIVANSDRQFLGDRIKTYYKSGLWPVYKGDTPVNGGLPQRVIPSHYDQARKDFAKHFTPNFTGLGIIDFESWRPLFYHNFGVMDVYKRKSRDLVRHMHPEYNNSMVEKEAESQWDAAAREMLERTLAVAQDLMPRGHWGYYLQPRTYYDTVNKNNRLVWLWRQSTGIFPSIYLSSNPDTPVANMEAWVQSVVKEAVRVQATFSRPNTPVFPYSVIERGGLSVYPLEHLEVAIGLPARMGVSGVVIWGSSGIYRQRGMCLTLQTYVHDVLGPYVQNLTSFLKDCSHQLCSGHGRCVRNDLDFLITSSTNQPSDCVSSTSTSHSRYHDYHCRCYGSWSGQCCQTREMLPC